MSTYTVTSLADNGGSGTLRHEITVASASTGPQTIVFSPSLAGGTVNLASGSLVLNHSSGELTIQGGTGDEVTVDAQNNSRVFTIASGTTAELDNLVITGGNTTANGGGIDNDGTLTLNNDTVTNNFASGEGGGIANENGGTATINDSTISNNHAALGGSLVPTQADGQTSASTYGSYGNSGNNYLAAFDGNTNTYFDAPGSDGNWIQLDLGSPIAITQIGYAPRTSLESRMVGGVFEASNDPTFSTGVTTLYTVTSAPADGMTYQTISPSVDCEYVRYVSPAGSYGNIAEMQVFNTTGNAGGQVSPLSGVPSANTTGSYDGIGNNYTMAFDGNTNTYFDAPTSDGNWIQMDLGTPMTISQIVYAPRVTWESRMVGGIFEGSDDSTFTTGVTTLFTVTSAPADGYNSQGINSSGTYRYIRYVSPSGSYGNIAEMQVFVIDGAGSAIFNGVYPNNALTIVNSTISGNIAPGRFGGAIAGGNATINITDATISGNSGGGVAGGSSVTINGTIAANNSGQDVSVPVASVGSYDLIGDGSGGLTGTNNSFGSIASPINPLLGALANNGGVTQTMALLPGSPAIGGGSLFYNASGYAVTADQRGLDLPDGVTPDIGAYDTEAGTTSPGLRIEVLGMNGSQGATATSIGQVIQLEVWAVVTGSNPNGALDTVSSVAGSFISSMASTGSVHGDLSDSLNESNLGFGAYGTQAGTQQDLNGDGNLDIGSDDGSNIADYMNARAGQNVTGIVTPFTDEVYIGNLYYTVTSLPSGGEADINFFPRPVIGPGYAAEWQQDGQPENETTATLAAGTPFRINAGSAPIDPIQPSIEPDVPPPSAPQAIPPAASASTIVALAGSGAFSITYSSGQYSFSGGTTSISPVSASNFGGFTFTGGGASDTLTISGAGGDPTLLNDAGSDGTSLAITVESGTITFNTTEHLSSLAIGAGAAATMSANGRSVLVTNSLSLAGSLNAWTGTLDLSNNGLIVHGGTLSTITNQLKTGCNGGSWNGPGIDSSAIADVQYDTVGVISNGGSATAYYSTFDGQSVSSSDILVQYTYNGDVDLNGQVDGNDYSLLDNGYVNHLAGWLNGDVNYDGVVNGSDYTLIDNTFNNEGSPIVNPGTGVLPAPRNLTASVFSSTEIDLSWIDDASAPDAVNDVIYESTDNGATFNPIDSVASVPAGSTNTYAATGLAPGSSYEFYVTEGGGAAPESSPSNIFTESTPFVPPTLDVEGTGTVVEGQPYQLSLSASYPDGEPGAVTQFSVDWNDGPGGTSNISNYSVTAGVDPTVPLVVTHTFAQGVASPTITVTATDGINGTFGPVTQSVAVIPMTPPPLNYTVASGNEIDLMWGVPSYISTGTILFESTDGVNFNPIYEVAAGVTNYAVTGLNPDTQYWFQAEADSVNGQSAPSTVGPILTDEYMEPLLAVSALGPATENKPLSLSLSWTALQNGLVNDDIISWTVDWGDGNGPQTYQALSSRALLSESNIYSGSTASALVTVDAIDGSNRTFTALSQVFAIAPATPTAVTASYENGGTSVSLNWYDDSQVASDYLVQRELLGSSWTNVDTVTASDGPEYSAVDAGLTAGANGSGGGYLYRVIAQGQQLTDVACPAKSAPSGVIAPFQAVLSSGTTIMVGSGGASSYFGETGGSPSVFEVTVGGVAEVPVSVLDAQVAGEAGVELNVTGYDSATMAPFETTVTTDANGLAYIPIQGIEAGATAIVVTDSGGDEGSGEINVTAPATTNASQYQVSLPNTPITSPNGGTDDIQCNLTASTSAVSADDPQDALVDGISGSLTDLTTGQTIQGFDPRHIYIYPAVGDSAPLVIYDPDLLPIDDTTDLPDPPPPTTVYYDIPIAITTSSFSLTAKDANQGLGYKHNNDPNAEPTVVATPTVTADLYVGEQPAIDNQKNGRAQAGGTAVLTLSSLNGATWKIQPTSKNGNSEVSATNGNFNGGPVTLTLTPSPDLNNSDPGDLTYSVTATFGQMTAVVTIHILKMDVSTETINEHPDTSVPGSGNVYGPDLSPATQQTSGAYIPWDTLDEDYDGIPDYKEAHGGSWMGSTVAHHPVVGDTLMMRIELQNVAGLTPGSYFLVIPQNVAVYEDYDGSNPVGGSTPFSGVGETTLYVEGISAANFKSPNNILWANWSATGNPRAITVTHADGFKITTFKWSGSQDVPGNTTYTYIATGAANAVGWTTVANGKLSTGANKSIAAITWNNGPAFGEAVYTINDNYSWEFTVNVVQVGLNLNRTNSITLTSDVPGYTTKGTPLTILAQPPASNTPAMQASVSLNAIAGPQVNGTGIMRGARWIEVGFLQTVQITSLTATYQSGNTTALESDKGWADGNTHIDGLPGVAGSIYPWLDTTQSKGLEYLSSTSTYNNAHLLTDNGSQPQVLSTNDSPVIPAAPALRLPSNKALLLSQTQMYLEFELYVAVATTKLDDPTAEQQAGSGSATDNIYTPLGKQSWYFDGTGNVTTNGEPGRTSWTATAAGTGSIADNGSVLHNTGFLPPTRQLGPATPITIPSGDKGLYAIQRDHGWKLNN